MRAAQAELAGRVNAGEAREAAQRLLEQQLHSQFPNARQCGGCGAGPVDHAACYDLTTHHGERRGAASINNACPRCRWFSPDVAEWPRWNGRLPRDDGGEAAEASVEAANLEAADSEGEDSEAADVLRAWRAQCPELRELWDESGSVTAWEGVTFGEAGGAHAGRVVEIMLEDKGVTGDVPAALGGLTALQELRLNENQLTSVPAALGALTALTVLDLDGNQLTSVPAALGELTALEVLILRGNRLTSVPAELGALTALTSLELSYNQLTSVPAELGALTALEVLLLHGNQLTSVPAAWERGGALEKSGCRIKR